MMNSVLTRSIMITYIPTYPSKYIMMDCGNNDRIIKYDIKADRRHLSQWWFCWNCKRYSFTPLSSINGEEFFKQKIAKQLIKRAQKMHSERQADTRSRTLCPK